MSVTLDGAMTVPGRPMNGSETVRQVNTTRRRTFDSHEVAFATFIFVKRAWQGVQHHQRVGWRGNELRTEGRPNNIHCDVWWL